MMDPIRYSCVIIIFFAVFLFTGCQSAPKSDFVPKTEEELTVMESLNVQAHNAFLLGNYKQAESILRQLTAQRTVSRTQYQLELLSVLLLDSRHKEAHALMQNLHQDLETLFDRKLEEKAQSLWHGEVNKVYKGDSYERATFYALMALSFIRSGKYEDALRCVKNGLLADGDSNSDKSVNDYGLLLYLGYFAAARMNDKAEAEEYLRGLDMALGLRGFRSKDQDEKINSKNCFDQLKDPGHNVLLVIWTGQGPEVECLGEYKEKRTVIRGRNPFDFMGVTLGGAFSPFMMPNNLGDLDYQATTRGGRLMDNVLADKAAAKKAMEVSRNVLFVVGTGLIIAGGRTMGTLPVGVSLLGAGVGCYVLGGTAYVVGYFMNPAADSRFWRNIPCQLYIVPLRLPAGEHIVMVNGYRNFDLAGAGLFTIEVKDDVPVNVHHLSMLNQNCEIDGAAESKLNDEIFTAREKADLNPMAKEL